jgi:predicted ABC-type ATPase
MSRDRHDRPPDFIVLAGPNGSGKSTFFNRRLAKWDLPFVNPDIIAKEIAPFDPSGAALRASRIADEERAKLLAQGVPFVTEGIRPDPRLLKEAKDRGYYTRVLFVCVTSPDLNVARVSLRVLQGGHSVPEDAIVARYARSVKSLPEAVQIADQVLLFDNSNPFRPHRLIARFNQGKLVTLRNIIPSWANSVFAKEFAEFRAARSSRNM